MEFLSYARNIIFETAKHSLQGQSRVADAQTSWKVILLFLFISV